MKIRNGFVSNSSSSSFIIVGNENTEKLIFKKKLNFFQKLKVINYILHNWSDSGYYYNSDKQKVYKSKISFLLKGIFKNVYLTDYIYDCGDKYPFCWSQQNFFKYDDGGFNAPYAEEYYVEIDDNIWLRK